MAEHDGVFIGGRRYSLVEKKDKSYIPRSGKDGYIKVFYLVSGKSEKFEVEWCRDVPLLEVTWYRYGNHSGTTVGRRGRKFRRMVRGDYRGGF